MDVTSSWLFLASCLVCLLWQVRPSQSLDSSSFMHPFKGQGVDPPEDLVDVYVTAYLKQLLLVQDKRYNFEAQVFLRFTWIDPRAATQIAQRTAEIEAANSSASECNRWCLRTNAACCDSIWLPETDFVNTRDFDQGRVEDEEVGVGGPGTASVFWQKKIHGLFYSSLDFRQFPFDSQVLTILCIARSGTHHYIASQVANEMQGVVRASRANNKDDVSGWFVANVTLSSNAVSEAQIVAAATESDPEDPFPTDGAEARRLTFYGPGSATLIDKMDPAFIIDIHAKRLSSLYIYSYLVPLALATLISCTVFLMDGVNEVTTRVTTIGLLFVAVTALQWTINSMIPATPYRTIMDKEILLSYCTMALAMLETVFVHFISRKDLAMVKARKKSVAPLSMADVMASSTTTSQRLQSQSSLHLSRRGSFERISSISAIGEDARNGETPSNDGSAPWPSRDPIPPQSSPQRGVDGPSRSEAEGISNELGFAYVRLKQWRLVTWAERAAAFLQVESDKAFERFLAMVRYMLGPYLYSTVCRILREALTQSRLFLGLVDANSSGRMSQREGVEDESMDARRNLCRMGSLASTGVQGWVEAINNLKSQLRQRDDPGNATRAAFSIDRTCLVLVPVIYVIAVISLYDN